MRKYIVICFLTLGVGAISNAKAESSPFAKGSGFLKEAGALDNEGFMYALAGLFANNQAVIDEYWKTDAGFSVSDIRGEYLRRAAKIYGRTVSESDFSKLISPSAGQISYGKGGAQLWNSYESTYFMSGTNQTALWNPGLANQADRPADPDIIFLAGVPFADRYCGNTVWEKQKKQTTTPPKKKGGSNVVDFPEEENDNNPYSNVNLNYVFNGSGNTGADEAVLKFYLTSRLAQADQENQWWKALEFAKASQSLTQPQQPVQENPYGYGGGKVGATSVVYYDGQPQQQQQQQSLLGGLLEEAAYGLAGGFGSNVGWNLGNRLFYGNNRRSGFNGYSGYGGFRYSGFSRRGGGGGFNHHGGGSHHGSTSTIRYDESPVFGRLPR